MQSRTLVNLSLLVLLIALASFIFSRQSGDTEQLRITHIHPDTINTIIIPRDKGDIILHKQQGDWHMQSPYQMRAHSFRIEHLLNLLQAPVDKSYDIATLDLKTFGLDKPRSEIHFDDIIIKYGKVNPINNNRYVLVDNKLYLIKDELYPLINSQPSSFVDLRLLTDKDIINKIVVPGFSIFKDENTLWRTTAKDNATADSLQQFVDNWQLAQAFGVHAYLERKQLGTIEIHLQDNHIIRLLISDDDPWLILAQPEQGIEYHFDKSFIDKLLKLSGTAIENNNA